MCATASTLGPEKEAKALRPAGARGRLEVATRVRLGRGRLGRGDGEGARVFCRGVSSGPDCQGLPCVPGTCAACMGAAGPDFQILVVFLWVLVTLVGCLFQILVGGGRLRTNSIKLYQRRIKVVSNIYIKVCFDMSLIYFDTV